MSCNGKCDTCKSKCTSVKFKLQSNSNIKKTVAVMSGKGGVGKSYVTSLLAAMLNRKGYKVGILDADITGPSIPKALGLKGKVRSDGEYIYPAVSKEGVECISMNLMLDNESDPVIWRGPILNGIISQFYSNVYWGDLDILLIDMPPGTGDIPLSVFNYISLDGAVIVSAPQNLAGMIVEKSYNMAKKMGVNILALVENMAYFQCDECGKVHKLFGESRVMESAKRCGIDTYTSLAFKPQNTKLTDEGRALEAYDKDLENVIERIVNNECIYA